MAGKSGEDADQFEFSEGVTKILNQGEEGWIDILPWDFKASGWIDVIPWDFQATAEGTVMYKDVAVAKVQTNEDDEVWLANLVMTLHDEGFF